MDNSTPHSTLTVKGRTGFAQIPKWVLRSQGDLSGNAVHLYGVIMSYASNDELTAFPGRERLAEDIGKSVDAVSRYIKELETYGALQVERRRNKRTGNFYANRYSMVWNPPHRKSAARRDGTSAAITIPTELTRPTNLYTVNSEESTGMLHDDTGVPPRDQKNPMAGMTQEQRSHALLLIQAIGGYLKQGYDYWGETVQGLYGDLYWHLEEHTANWGEHDALTDMLNNGKWTFSAKVADPYEAGIELNKMLHTAKYVS